MKKLRLMWLWVLFMGILLVSGCEENPNSAALQQGKQAAQESRIESYSLEEIPEYSGSPYVILNNNEPDFTEQDLSNESYEFYSELDELGRCGEAFANIGRDLMPTQKRGSIGKVKPSGWYTVKYENVDGKYLYNRCHLIGYQLTAENANEKNLITGTRYLNIEGMLPFENMVADYIKETENHVLYRVTPVFKGDNLVASGVKMEAKSVEDDGDGICFNIYAYNVQPQVTIEYDTGVSFINEETEDVSEINKDVEYILNTNSHKFHLPSCSGVTGIKEENKKVFRGTRSDVIDQGYEACKRCNP